jgi:hypothetical protein
MRVALCLSGHLRSLKDNFPNYHEHLLSNPEYKIDIFIHTWDKLNYLGGGVLPAWGAAREIVDLYKPKEILFDRDIQFRVTEKMKNQNPNMRNINGVLGMFYKIKAVNDLKSAYEKSMGFRYDCVIRSRPDIKLRGKVDLNQNMDYLYVPQFGDFSGLNDQFAFSSSENMDKYCDTFSHIERYVDDGMIVNPEFFTDENVKEQGLQLRRPYIPYVIKWLNGDELDNEVRSKNWVEIR